MTSNNNKEAVYDFHYYSFYKKVRNQIREYESDSIITYCLSKLREIDTRDNYLYNNTYNPWYLLLMMKFTYENYSDDITVNPINIDKFNKIYNMFIQFDYSNYFSNKLKIIYNIIFQQKDFQRIVDPFVILRTKIIFELAEKNNPLFCMFEKKFEISINKFVELSFLLVSQHCVGSEVCFFNEDFFNICDNMYSKNEILQFWESISIDEREIVPTLNTKQRINKNIEEFFEVSPFVNFPLIKKEGKYRIVSKYLLFSCLDYFVYDSLKQINKSKLMNCFSSFFELYINKLLLYSGLEFINEKTIKSIIGNNKKVVDYIIFEQDAAILIDAKAVELSKKAKFSNKMYELSNSSKNSHKKGILQACSCIRDMFKSCDKLDNKELFIVIATYKEMMICNGLDLEEILGKEKMDELVRIDDETKFPLENIYFLNVQDLELAIEYSKSKKITDIFRVARENDSKPETRKFLFKMHLEKQNINTYPEFFKDYSNAIIDNVLKNIPPTTSLQNDLEQQ